MVRPAILIATIAALLALAMYAWAGDRFVDAAETMEEGGVDSWNHSPDAGNMVDHFVDANNMVEVSFQEVQTIIDEMVYAMRHFEDIHSEADRDDSETIAARVFLLYLGRLDLIPEPGEVARVEREYYENILEMRHVTQKQFRLQGSFLAEPKQVWPGL